VQNVNYNLQSKAKCSQGNKNLEYINKIAVYTKLNTYLYLFIYLFIYLYIFWFGERMEKSKLKIIGGEVLSSLGYIVSYVGNNHLLPLKFRSGYFMALLSYDF
jgi:uncharacterized membrane protein